MFSKILLPIDVAEPETAKKAIDVATSMAATYKASLRLVHVTSPIVVAAPMAVIPQSVYDALNLAGKAELDRLAATIDGLPGAVSTTVRVGGIYPELLAEANKLQINIEPMSATEIGSLLDELYRAPKDISAEAAKDSGL